MLIALGILNVAVMGMNPMTSVLSPSSQRRLAGLRRLFALLHHITTILRPLLSGARRLRGGGPGGTRTPNLAVMSGQL